MGIRKNILIDGKEIAFKTSAAVPRLYRVRFKGDFFKDISSLKENIGANNEEESALDLGCLEIFENIAYIMAKHADPDGVPSDPDEWLEQFEMFSIYNVLPQLIELWGLNLDMRSESKKNIARLTGK